MVHKVAVLAGDGIGPEIVDSALKVFDSLGCDSEQFVFTHGLIGGAAFDAYGSHFPSETRALCLESAAVLFGSVGGPISASLEPKWKDCEKNSILALRETLQVHSNLRILRTFPGLEAISPLRWELTKGGLDILVVRELLGDIYFGDHTTRVESGERISMDVAEYSESQVRRVAKTAFESARGRGGKVTSIDKANVLDTSKLWRAVVSEVHEEYRDVKLEHMLVDNCAMQLVRSPKIFDVLLTPNLFGDILSDLVSALGGSLGLMPSASLSDTHAGLYEPAGGSAPDIAGLGEANPIAQIVSLGLMLKYSFGLTEELRRIESAIAHAVSSGVKTKDLCRDGEKSSTTAQFTDAVIDALKNYTP